MYSKDIIFDKAFEAAKEYFRGGGQLNPDYALQIIYTKLIELNEDSSK